MLRTLRRIRAAFGKHVCPYCFELFSLKHVKFRCVNPRCSARTADETLKNKWQETGRTGKVMPTPGVFSRQVRCDTCEQRTKKRLCPNCHKDLPVTLGECPNLIFAVIGAKESGKSHYIAVLIEQLRNNIGPAMDLLLEPLDDFTIKTYRDRFHDPLYRKKVTLQATVSGMADASIQLPLVFSLKQCGKGLFGGQTIKRTVTLVFFDTAGEDLNDENTMSIVNKYIYRSNGLIVLLDPLQLSHVRERLKTSINLPSQNTETIDILARTANLIRNGRELGHDKMIKTPIAVAFSKFDAVQSSAGEQFQLNQFADHSRGFNVADSEAVNDEMQSLVARWEEGEGMLNQVRNSFLRASYFGVSALGEGCDPSRPVNLRENSPWSQDR